MERFILINWTVLCVAVLFFETVLSTPHESSVPNERNDDSKETYFWFGPRLGRKKRNSSNDDLYQDMQKEELVSLTDALQDVPWAIIAVNDLLEGKRHVVNFTPRLGRESGEEFVNNAPEDRWLQNHETSGEMLYQRSPPFAPRLGRHSSPFSPRLGRENDRNLFS
ncbi:PBAN-type neuropeptides isoform X1 [Tribolium castaneum]|uniref:Pyrokinin n=1 Tax=Tribolium castaneum TaxID=7070 RepID=D6W7C9_TRICA|nr:PREDICTED: PBAN-type neuropeptides isoform X1 [Tribolium castaneum]EFA11568.2 pyrokinin [Tribolium castaneum]|eukprot:XP_008200603.2 PREDICTED: PBAN-type neuropeptides isoform X1 [Tribolium castaneum]